MELIKVLNADIRANALMPCSSSTLLVLVPSFSSGNLSKNATTKSIKSTPNLLKAHSNYFQSSILTHSQILIPNLSLANLFPGVPTGSLPPAGLSCLSCPQEELQLGEEQDGHWPVLQGARV